LVIGPESRLFLTMTEHLQNSAENHQFRAEVGRKLSRALTDALFFLSTKLDESDAAEIATLAARISLCNSPQNLVEAGEVIDKTTGEIFPFKTHLWRCGSKLCPDCVASESRRNRKKIQEAIGRQKLIVGEHFHFLTFTIPNPGLELLETRELVNAAWQLFRKRKWTRNRLIGYAKSEEFTLTRKGYHYHLHLLVRSKYIFYDRLRTEWTECVRAVFEAAGHRLEIATADRLLIVNCQRVGSMSDAINELCKYVTKADSWKRISKSDLIQAALVRRWHRMFELGGTFSSRNANKTPSSDVEDDLIPFDQPKVPPSLKVTILDTKSLSDGKTFSTSESWRNQLRALGIRTYAKRLTMQIRNAQAARARALAQRYEGIEPHLPAIRTTREALSEAIKLASRIRHFASQRIAAL
jgi:hypothetical protein